MKSHFPKIHYTFSFEIKLVTTCFLNTVVQGRFIFSKDLLDLAHS